MLFQVSDVWRAPAVNPVNRKARFVPVLNVVDPHGRVFFFSWMGFMIAFWAWYTFPPLVKTPRTLLSHRYFKDRLTR